MGSLDELCPPKLPHPHPYCFSPLVEPVWRFCMSKSTKWILGIAIGLVCVIALVAFGYLAFSWWNGSGWMGSGWMMETPRFRAWGDRGDIPWQRMPMHPGWGMPYSRFGGLYPLRVVASGLLCLGVLALIVLGAIALVRVLSRPSQATEKPVLPVEPAQNCSNCGRPLQNDWSHCPYCGNPVAAKSEDESPPG